MADLGPTKRTSRMTWGVIYITFWNSGARGEGQRERERKRGGTNTHTHRESVSEGERLHQGLIGTRAYRACPCGISLFLFIGQCTMGPKNTVSFVVRQLETLNVVDILWATNLRAHRSVPCELPTDNCTSLGAD